MKERLLLKCNKSPGDILMLSAAVRDLYISHGDSFELFVKTSCADIWRYNPYVKPYNEKDQYDLIVDCEYPLVNKSNTTPHHFIHGYRLFLEDKLNLKIPPTEFKGDIHFSDLEKKWISQVQETGNKKPFWIMCAGGKFDFTSKWWNPDKWQKVVDHFKDKILFVQTGKREHFHPKLSNVVDLVGKTNLRQYIRLFYHSIGVISPITCAMHFAAAVPSKFNLKNRPCVVVASGIEPTHWEKYPTHQYITRAGTMKCCDRGGCWKIKSSEIIGEDLDPKKVCSNRVFINDNPMPEKISSLYVPSCMNSISVDEVINSIELYYNGGILDYLSQ